MASCERVNGCPMFKQFRMKSTLAVWQARYCDGDFSQCERWKRVHAGQEVPAALLPNGKLLTVPVEQLEAKHLA